MALPPPKRVEIGAFYRVLRPMELSAVVRYTTFAWEAAEYDRLLSASLRSHSHYKLYQHKELNHLEAHRHNTSRHPHRQSLHGSRNIQRAVHPGSPSDGFSVHKNIVACWLDSLETFHR